MKAEDIIFWILVLIVAVILIWMAFGSPSIEEVAVPIGLFIIGSEILLWKALFAKDKLTAVSFIKMKSDIEKKYEKIENELITIKKMINRRE